MARSISIAMIVKDEAANLEECLSGLSRIADELCVVDTGSHDDSVELARKHHARVSIYIWCDDFSAARNESLRLCESDWIFVVDADERIAEEDASKVKALAEGGMDAAYRFCTRNYTNTTNVSEFRPCSPGDPHARGFAGWYPSYKVRFFPNHRGARFEGKVHELVHKSLSDNGIRIVDSDVPIHHYPFTKSPEEVQRKRELYLNLAHEKVRAAPNDPKALAELGEQYVEVGDFANAAAAFRESLKYDPHNPLVLKDLGGALHLMNRPDEAKQALRLAVDLAPDLAEGWRNLGVILGGEKDWNAAADCFREAVKHAPDSSEAHRCLSVALEQLGHMAEAAEASGKALALHPESGEALRLYVHQMLRLERREEARRVLETLVQPNGQCAGLHDALGELYYYDALYEAAAAHFDEAGRQGIAGAYNNLGVVYFRLKRFEEARDAFEKCLASDPGHRGARENLRKALAHLK